MSISASYSFDSQRWFSVIEHRRSRRKFDPSKHIPPDTMSRVKLLCKRFRPFVGVRAELVSETPSRLFKGAVGPYGKVSGAPAFVAFIGDMNATNMQEQIGYVGEAIILEMTALGLGTCWVGGFFRKEVAASAVNLTESERVIAVTPIGYAKQLVTFGEKAITGFGRSHRRKRLSVLTTGLHSSKWPQWIRASLQAARLAPSAVNRQPWRFKVGHESITVSDGTKGPDFNVSKRLDCGIAMLHIEVAAANCGATGEWQFLESPSVARFEVE